MERTRRALIDDGVEPALDESMPNDRQSAGFASATPKMSVGAGVLESHSYRPRRLAEGQPVEQTTPNRPVRPRRALPVEDLVDDDAPPVPELEPIPERDLESATKIAQVPGQLPASPAPGSPVLDRPVVKPHSRHLIDPIVIDGLIKSYNGSLAVRNLSFTVEPGRVTGFLGPNGAGKTTTLRILVGLITATAGHATFGDTPYARLPQPQRSVGAVLESNFHPGRSGRNHLRVLAPTAGASNQRVDELLEQVGLTQAARRPAGQYSLGMRQRLALAAALLGDPDYLILDEPANGLDPEGIRWLRAFLRNFADTGRTVLMSSHLLNEVQATADDIVVINRGRLLAEMPITDLELGGGRVKARVSDIEKARHALLAIAAEVEIGNDARGQYLTVHSHEVAAVGTALFGAGVVVYELGTETRNLEQEFFAMLEKSP